MQRGGGCKKVFFRGCKRAEISTLQSICYYYTLNLSNGNSTFTSGFYWSISELSALRNFAQGRVDGPSGQCLPPITRALQMWISNTLGLLIKDFFLVIWNRITMSTILSKLGKRWWRLLDGHKANFAPNRSRILAFTLSFSSPPDRGGFKGEPSAVAPPGNQIFAFLPYMGRKISDQFMSLPPPGKILYPPLQLSTGCRNVQGGRNIKNTTWTLDSLH